MASCSCVRSLQGHTGSINTLEVTTSSLVQFTNSMYYTVCVSVLTCTVHI